MNNEDYESDNSYEEEYMQNEIPPSDVDDKFREVILDAKRSLNTKIINGPELGTRESQSIKLVNNYINALNHLYVLSLDAQRGINVINEKNLSIFPVETKDKIELALQYITDYFKKLNIVDKIPYEHYIRQSFKENQFLLHNNFD